jgi:hypothetical protein
MQGLDPEEHNLPQNPSNEGTINEGVSSEIGSIAPPIDHPEGVVETMEEGFPSSTNPPLTGPFGQPLVEFPSTSYMMHFFFLPFAT